MKFALSLGLLWVTWLTAAGQSTAGAPRPTPVNSGYVGLDDWARANRFQLSWLNRNQELKAVRGGTVLLFPNDSRKFSFNGINLWLSAPIVAHNGMLHIAAIDLPTALQPLLTPPKNPGGRKIRTICLDPGHGGKDTGCLPGRQQEKKLTLLLAQDVRQLLLKAGFRVVLTRNNDTFIDLPLRPEIGRRAGADLFVSLHFNAALGQDGASVKGAEVYGMTPARTSSTNARGEGATPMVYPGNRSDARNWLLGYCVHQALVRQLGTEDRGVRRARFAVLRAAEVPAILVEGGFLTHPTEGRKIFTAAYRRQLAQAIVSGLITYKKLVE